MDSISSRERLFVVFAVLASVCLFYIASCGPVAHLVAAKRISHRTYLTIYAPLAAASEKSKPVGDLLDWYVKDLWRVPWD